jgi:hypothetical protein
VRTLLSTLATEDSAEPLPRHTNKVWGQIRNMHTTDVCLTVVSHSFEGPFTLWDGNHRALSLFTIYELLRARAAATTNDPPLAQALGQLIDMANLTSFFGVGTLETKRFGEIQIQTLVGISDRFRNPHRGSFYCGAGECKTCHKNV